MKKVLHKVFVYLWGLSYAVGISLIFIAAVLNCNYFEFSIICLLCGAGVLFTGHFGFGYLCELTFEDDDDMEDFFRYIERQGETGK